MTVYSGNTIKKKKKDFREVTAKQKDAPAQSGPLQVVATKRVHASHSCLQGQGASFCLCAEHQTEHSMETNVWEKRNNKYRREKKTMAECHACWDADIKGLGEWRETP